VNNTIDGRRDIATAVETEHARDSAAERAGSYAVSAAAEEHTRDYAASAADEHAREYATDPQRSILLQAPAGSGKTTVLTQRLLRLLAEVEEPEEILAITFTRKAAAEMRARVLKALRGEIDTNTEQGRRLQALASAALERGAGRGWNLAQDPGRLRIQTIDSFNFRLASQLPVTAKAGGALTITDRPSELYSRAARATLVAAESDPILSEDIEFLFERLDNNWRNVEELLASMLQQRGHWLRYVLGHEPQALCARINESLGNIVRDHLDAACGRLSAPLRAEAGSLPQAGLLGNEPECLAAWKGLASLTLTQKGEWRKPRGITKALGPLYEDAAAKDALRACLERVSGVAGAREVLVDLSSLPAAELFESDATAIMALSRVLRAAAIQLQAEFAIDGRVDHTYIGGAARAALADAGLPTDLALRTGLSLRHILVDEFQDTSLAQFDLVEALTAGWEEGEGRTLFVVGDPMQSIYQFREAEVGLFLRARDSGIGGVRLEALRLSRNFRSIPQLIEWTNDAFTSLFPASDDLRASAVAFTPSLAGLAGGTDAAQRVQSTTSQAGGGSTRDMYVAPRAGEDPSRSIASENSSFSTASDAISEAVRLRLFSSDNRASETTAIIERIVEQRADDPTATIAILVAARTHAAAIMLALEARAIDAIGVDLVPLRDLSVVRDLVALLEALHHLGDRTAWLAVLRAPWCGLSLETLTAISRRRDAKLPWEAMADVERLSHCDPQELRRLARVRGVLANALETRDSVPLADWLETTWLRLGAADAYPKEDLRHARAFLAALSDRAASGEWNGPGDIGSLLGDLYAQPQASTPNPVQIMTIHRAKGLEFDHVFVPSLDRNLNRGREPLLRWLDLPRREGESDLVMAPVPAIGDDDGGSVGIYLKRLMAKRNANEQTRLLYVATTRAKKTLFLSAAPKTKQDGTVIPRTGTLLASLWPALGDAFKAGERRPQFVSRSAANIAGEEAAWPRDGQVGPQFTGDRAAITDGGMNDVAAPSGAAASSGTVAPAEVAERSNAGGSATEATPATPPLRRLPADWSPPTFEPTATDLSRLPIGHQSLEPPEFSWVGETGRHIGTVVHAALESFASAAELPTRTQIQADRDSYTHQLRRHGVPDRDLPLATDRVLEALTNTVGNERGRWIFAPEHREAHSELALTGIASGRLTQVIIDRSFVDGEGTRWVIDFKTSRHEGGGLDTFLKQELERYRSQLETYVALARGLGPNPVRAGLYFPLLGVFRELA
jgi:ATP-dependent helicase/nuclease subunit A